MLSGLMLKLIVCPIGVIFASLIFPNIDFAYWYQPIVLGVVLAVVGYYMEKLMLTEGTKWLSLIMDFIVSIAIVYFGVMLFADAEITLGGAVLTSGLLVITEFFQHNWLLQSGRALENLAYRKAFRRKP